MNGLKTTQVSSVRASAPRLLPPSGVRHPSNTSVWSGSLPCQLAAVWLQVTGCSFLLGKREEQRTLSGFKGVRTGRRLAPSRRSLGSAGRMLWPVSAALLTLRGAHRFLVLHSFVLSQPFTRAHLWAGPSRGLANPPSTRPSPAVLNANIQAPPGTYELGPKIRTPTFLGGRRLKPEPTLVPTRAEPLGPLRRCRGAAPTA